MNYIEDIKSGLDFVADSGKDYNSKSTKEWTHDIKNSLIKIWTDKNRNSIENTSNFRAYASSCIGANGGEWLYDLIWLKYEDDKFVDVELVLESEWKINGVDYDF